MTTFDKSSLQALWINGFVPQGSDYANLIQSQVNIAETSLQVMAGALSTTELNAPLVSGSTLNVATVSAVDLYAGGVVNMDCTTFSVSAQGGLTIAAQGNVVIDSAVNLTLDAFAGDITHNASNNFNVSAGTSITVNSGITQNYNAASNFNVSAGSVINMNAGTSRTDNVGLNYALNVANNITVSAQGSITMGGTSLTINAPTKVSGALSRNQAIVSAAGTAQATGAAISSNVGFVRLQGTTDGQATGYLLPAPASSSNFQLLNHEGTVSGNLWPSVGCKINGLANNAAFAMAANTPYYVIYTGASSYAVK